jgi:hypothetical protein
MTTAAENFNTNINQEMAFSFSTNSNKSIIYKNIYYSITIMTKICSINSSTSSYHINTQH